MYLRTYVLLCTKGSRQNWKKKDGKAKNLTPPLDGKLHTFFFNFDGFPKYWILPAKVATDWERPRLCLEIPSSAREMKRKVSMRPHKEPSTTKVNRNLWTFVCLSKVRTFSPIISDFFLNSRSRDPTTGRLSSLIAQWQQNTRRYFLSIEDGYPAMESLSKRYPHAGVTTSGTIDARILCCP